jgi:hypothetical protein
MYGESPAKAYGSPVNGNAFTGAMAKTGGDYEAAKEMLDSSPTNYGSPLDKSKSGMYMRACGYKK